MGYEISVAVAPIRREPSDRSEMVSQGLYGEELQILEKQEKWAMVRMQADGYEGWVDCKQFCEIQLGQESTQLSATLTFCTLPNKTNQWLAAGSVIAPDTTFSSQQPVWNGSEPHIEQCALQFLNAPYLWGGRTVMGIDCSGFTQLVMKLNGISIPRDAYQQADLGTEVTFVEEAITGDLAFFDNAEGRIIHVGIVLRTSIESVQIIHASGKVRIDALDHQGIFNRELSAYSHKLRIIKRKK